MHLITQNAKMVQIREQTLSDPASGVTIEFKVIEEDADCPYRIRLYGEVLRFGNRQFEVNKEGVIAGAGTALTECPLPFD